MVVVSSRLCYSRVPMEPPTTEPLPETLPVAEVVAVQVAEVVVVENSFVSVGKIKTEQSTTLLLYYLYTAPFFFSKCKDNRLY